jgi:urease alpha subunit
VVILDWWGIVKADVGIKRRQNSTKLGKLDPLLFKIE